MTAPVIEMIGLAKEYRVAARRVQALRGIDLELGRGEIVAVVGESGSGKTTLGSLVLGIEQPSAGSIRLNGETMPRRRSRAMRRAIQLVAQNPLSALNPKQTIFQSIALPLAVHGLVPRTRRRERAAELLDMVGLAPALLDRHPQVLSGGQRQRVALARAIAAEPQALVLDEPTSALDVSVQALVLQLLAELRQRLSLSYLFITHDLGIVRVLAHRVVVLFRGRIVEAGPTASVFASPHHRYTQMLISSVPVVTEAEERSKPDWPWDRAIGTGEAVAATGCPFRPRCPHAVAACELSEPALTELAPGHVASCYNPFIAPAHPNRRPVP
jgi:peptide/nickel transport system ATP-binding protein/oligopeptide transport system ATP-binding protein